MPFVDRFAFGTPGAAKAASDCDSDGYSYRQPDSDVACEDACSGADASA
jgi:hypothetical protein